jgi:isoquinoline 1-oxidoreductase
VTDRIRDVGAATLAVNGEAYRLRGAGERSLLAVLRDDLRLTGAKPGCGHGACGACTVLLDGEPVRACVTPASAAAARAVTTVEGLAAGPALHPLQEALLAEGAVQCGYCATGVVMAGAGLLARSPDPDRAAIRAALAGNVCRCGSYPRIERAVERAAAVLRGADVGRPPWRARPCVVASYEEFRPHRPWDLATPEEREYFDLLGDGLVVVLGPPPAARGSWSAPPGGAWLHVGSDGTVTAFTGKVDVGQDNRTALAAIVADELRVELHAVRVAMGDTDLCPFDRGTFGSRSLPDAGGDLRICAAAARELLAGGLPAAGERRVEAASRAAPLLPPARWRVRGRALPRAAARERVTGCQIFPSDVSRPGMLHGVVLRAPAHGARLRSVDVARARAIAGVTVVDEGGMVGVAAPELRLARAGLAAIAAEWTLPEQPAERELAAHLRAHPLDVMGWEAALDEEIGDVGGALATAALRLDATYATAYVAHVSPETRVAVAEWDEGRLTVWTGSQAPFDVRARLAALLGVAEGDVRVIVPDVGGGFGSKHTEPEAVAAARLARAAGAPVRVALDREQEFRFSHLRPAAVIDLKSGVDADGAIACLEQRTLNAGTAALAAPYAIPNRRIAFQPADSPLPQGPFRALAATANHFARESHIDEIAHALRADPLDLRLRHLEDERLAAVLRAAAEGAGWGSRRDEGGIGTGLAAGVEKGGRVATVVRLRLDGDGIEILGVVTAFECGALVNPDNVARQVEGATVMGLGGALFEAVHFAGGSIVNASLDAYRVPRATDVPPIEVLLLDRPDVDAAGAGETPIVAVAPAVANAIVAAGGPRLRSLPLLEALAASRA